MNRLATESFTASQFGKYSRLATSTSVNNCYLSLIFARLPLEFREFGIEIFLAGLKCRDFDESSFFKVIKFRKSSTLVPVS